MVHREGGPNDCLRWIEQMASREIHVEYFDLRMTKISIEILFLDHHDALLHCWYLIICETRKHDQRTV